MRLLVLSDIGATDASNPFTQELIKSLSLHPQCLSVDYGTFWLTSLIKRWDIVLIQWPEFLIKNEDYNALTSLKNWLSEVRLNSKIVFFVHNLYPHFNDTKFTKELYNAVYKASDAFIHLGRKSIELVADEEPSTIGKPVVVIPHGNYLCFGEEVSLLEARRRLRLPLAPKIVLVFGQIRSRKEFDLACSAVKHCQDKVKILIAGRIRLRPSFKKYNYIFQHSVSALSSLYYRARSRLTPNLLLHEGRIPGHQVPLYLSACNIVFIPRTEALNSGNIALAFTYGRIAVGPDIGNIGEILRETSNPTFNPARLDSIGSAMDLAFHLQSEGVGDANRTLAREKWNWQTISDRLINFFNTI